MGKIVKTTDFVGKYSITQNGFTTPKLQAFIDNFEKVYLYDMLGVTLGDLLYNDIASGTFLPPVTAIYADLFNPIYENTGYYRDLWRSAGIKDMITGFIYWEFVRDQSVINTITGPVNQQNEVSNRVDWNTTSIYDNYNSSVRSYCVIQNYCWTNIGDYPDYAGITKKLNSWAI